MSGRTWAVGALLWVLVAVPQIGLAQQMPKVKAKAPAAKEAKPPEDLTPQGVDRYLAGLSDEQARQLLASELKEKGAAKSSKESKDRIEGMDTGLALAFFNAQGALAAIEGQLAGMGAGLSLQDGVWEAMVGGRGLESALLAIASLMFIVLLGLGAERLLLRRTEGFRTQLLEQIPCGGWEKAGLIFSRLLLDLAGLGVYTLVTFLGFFLVYGRQQPANLVASAIIVSYYFRLIELVARLVTSPRAPELRPLILSDEDARFIYRWVIGISAAALPGSVLAFALQKSGASRDLFLMVYSTTGPIVSLLLAMMIWRTRHRVAALICPEDSSGTMRRRCAENWHYPAILLALLVGGYWWVRVLTHADATIIRLLGSLFLLPLCIAMDQWLYRMLQRLSKKQREVYDLSQPEAPRPRHGRKRNISIYFPLVRRIFRTGLAVAILFAALDLWGIDLDVGWIFAKSVLGVIIALVLGLIAWEVAKAHIDARIAEEMPLGIEDAEEGGSGGSRSGTLLLLLRKFILAFLFVVVGFSVLASLGVNIAPLLAGAGVVGLAIGFGSQTLVKDIIAGVFFLIDDAFRVGDYVEAGTAKGTVEHISLRSLRLRHPRGQIFVVPFGDLKLVQNFTRDYIIEKLDIRVRFDTDPDLIRKIVKNINKEIKANEAMSRVLLSDIKSVGVRAMDDSAMIMRVKFKCIPGEQFLVRRQVYHQIQKAFKEKGIEFAHRNVTVYIPPQPAGAPAIAPEAAGAAAAAAIAQAEAEEMAKLAEKSKEGM